jgi:hypothetical protein
VRREAVHDERWVDGIFDRSAAPAPVVRQQQQAWQHNALNGNPLMHRTETATGRTMVRTGRRWGRMRIKQSLWAGYTYAGQGVAVPIGVACDGGRSPDLFR